MSLVSKNDQTQNAQILKDEVQEGANSRLRVYNLFKNLIDSSVFYDQIKSTTGNSSSDIISQSGVTSLISNLKSTISNSSAAFTGVTNLGGVAIYSGATNKTLKFKGLVAGSNITLTSSSTGITIASTAVSSPKTIGFACSDEITPLSTGTSKVTFRMPYAMTLTGVRASLKIAQSSGSTLTIDVNQNGSTILSTKLSIDNNEKTSATAAIAAVISNANLTDDAEITIDVDQIGNGTATGLKIWLIGT